jgi:hypothetical protein
MVRRDTDSDQRFAIPDHDKAFVRSNEFELVPQMKENEICYTLKGRNYTIKKYIAQ